MSRPQDAAHSQQDGPPSSAPVPASDRLAWLVSVQRALAGGSLEDCLPAFANALSARVPADLAIVARFAAGTSALLQVTAAGSKNAEPLALEPLETHLRREDARSAGVIFVEPETATQLAPWARSGCIVPLVAHDAAIGALVILSQSDELSTRRASESVRWAIGVAAEPVALALQTTLLFSQLREQTRRWESIFDAMDEIVLDVDANGRIRQSNRAAIRRLSPTSGSLVDRLAAALFPGQQLPSPEAPRRPLVGPQGEPLAASWLVLPGGGAAIVVRDARPANATPPRLRPTPPRGISSVVPGRRARLLVVDDEQSILRALTRTLGRAHDVVTANDGEAALAILRAEQGRFDVVISDVQMPRLAGTDLYRAVKDEFPQLAERMLLMTGGVFGREVESFLAELGTRVLRKPFDPEELRRTVERVLERAARG
jgi:CheY-like chemotaxis protein